MSTVSMCPSPADCTQYVCLLFMGSTSRRLFLKTEFGNGITYVCTYIPPVGVCPNKCIPRGTWAHKPEKKKARWLWWDYSKLLPGGVHFLTLREKQAGCFLKGKDWLPGHHDLLKSPEAQEGPQEMLANGWSGQEAARWAPIYRHEERGVAIARVAQQ